MRVVLELNIEQTVDVEFLQSMATRAMEAITGTSGPPVYPRLLLEMGPQYLEIPMRGEHVPRPRKI